FAAILGALVGLVIFVMLLPIVRVAIRALSSPEYFMLTLLGLFMVGILASRAALRGLTVVGLGLLVGMVGFAPNTDYPRFVFDSVYLQGGLPLVPIALGLFAVPEILDLLVKKSTISESE